MGRPLTIGEIADVVAAQQRDGDFHLECSFCSFGSMWENSLAEVIEHAMFDHSTRADVSLIRSTTLFSALELASMLNLTPQTEYEERWREEHPRP